MRSEIFEARNAWDFVKQLRNTAYIPQDNEYAYMRNYSKWAMEIDGNLVRWHSPELFVLDLETHGYLSIQGSTYQIGTVDEPNPSVSDGITMKLPF